MKPLDALIRGGMAVVAVMGVLAVGGCLSLPAVAERTGGEADSTAGRSDEGGPTPSPGAAEGPAENAYVTFLRTLDPPVPLFDDLSDEQLRQLGQDVCTASEGGAEPDEILRAWLETGAAPTDEAIIALFTAAEYTYCPGGIDLDSLYASPAWRERIYLDFVSDSAGRFSTADRESALEVAGAICDLTALGWTHDRLVAQLHGDAPVGLAPDRDGALALIVAAQWAFCPDASG